METRLRKFRPVKIPKWMLEFGDQNAKFEHLAPSWAFWYPTSQKNFEFWKTYKIFTKKIIPPLESPLQPDGYAKKISSAEIAKNCEKLRKIAENCEKCEKWEKMRKLRKIAKVNSPPCISNKTSPPPPGKPPGRFPYHLPLFYKITSLT